jgi:hypothetical protein
LLSIATKFTKLNNAETSNNSTALWLQKTDDKPGASPKIKLVRETLKEQPKEVRFKLSVKLRLEIPVPSTTNRNKSR